MTDMAGELEDGALFLATLSHTTSGVARQHMGRIIGDMKDAAAELRELRKASEQALRCIECFLPLMSIEEVNSASVSQEDYDEQQAVESVKQVLRAALETAQQGEGTQ